MARRFALQIAGAIAKTLKQRPRWTIAALTAGVLLAGFGLYSSYLGAPPIVYRDGLFYFSARPNTGSLSRSVRLALQETPPQAEPGRLTWRRLAPGFEVGELPVLVGREEVDRLYLTRIDPDLFEFRIHVAADKNLDAWMGDLHPAALINGSYYNAALGPATPVRIDGARSGPDIYVASHGAFVSSAHTTALVDLSDTDWRIVGADAQTMLVSYPTLLDEKGNNRAHPSRWLASRSFLAEGADGQIILGSAPEGFFSLYRLGEFLKRTPIRLRYVLNLDGGPVACQGVSIGGVTRRIYGHVEIQSDNANGPLRIVPSSRNVHALMPIVLAVYPREAQ